MSATAERTRGEMSTEASKFKYFQDLIQAMIDAVEIFIREICVKFISLWIELINYQQEKSFDIQRFVALLAILYVICFIDLDFIPIIGKIDDIIVMHYSYHYCCNKKQTIVARKIYKDYELYFKVAAIIWLLY